MGQEAKKIKIAELKNIIRSTIMEQINKEGWTSVRRSRGWDLDDDHYEGPEDFQPDDGDVKTDRASGEQLIWSAEAKQWLYEDEWVAANKAKEADQIGSGEELEEAAPIVETSPEKKKITTTYGQIPDEQVLYDLMDGEDFPMELKGADSMAWEYAMALDPNPKAGSTSAGKGMRASLQALVNAPNPQELTDEQFENVEHVLDRWYHSSPAYHEDYSIEDAAQSIASSIMSVLGVEWV
jgi:hypothetical protein